MTLFPGYLKKYFKGVVVKKLSSVETSPKTSNQHEFNATSDMRKIFGDNDQKFKTDFIYLDDENKIVDNNFLTWYDSRRRNPKRTEYRLYYPKNSVSDLSKEGDSLFICLKQDNTVLCVISKSKSDITSKLYWLFDINPSKTNKFVQNDSLLTESNQLEYLSQIILDKIGIEYKCDNDEILLSKLINKFGMNFPSTKLFSEFARSLVDSADPINNPDEALIKWYNMEERLFFLLEKFIVKEQLKCRFLEDGDINVDDFYTYSLSVLNRRKSRAGLSLENHISAILDANNISYSHTPITENKSKPDFLFPSIECYRNDKFPEEMLTMLGSKSSCKDRWRQVLSEAERIKVKHLLTLEPAISSSQITEMVDKKLQLVVPLPIHKTYPKNLQKCLYSLSEFLNEVKEKEEIQKNFGL